MGDRRSLLAALALSLAVAGAVQLPYLAADGLAGEGKVFAGFLMNPLDGFSYVAKMRQAAAGSWLFHLPYAADPGPGAFVYVYYLALGHLARALGASLFAVYGAARFLASALMFLTGYLFFRAALGEGGPIWTAYLLALFGSGLGWLGVVFGLVTPDLWMPEAIPLLGAYNNAHFSMACTGLLAAVLAVLPAARREPESPADPAAGGEGPRRLGARLALGFLAGTAVAVVLPFVVLSVAAILFIWIVWEKARGERIRRYVVPYAGFVTGAAPWLIYDLWLAMTHPAIAGWTAQNQTPSPPPHEFAIGYGLILLLAVLGAVRARPHSTPAGRLLLTWVVVNAFLLYAPFGLQRRLSLGLFFPLAALAALALRSFGGKARTQRTALIAAIILSFPSHLVVWGSGLAGVRRGEPALVMSEGEAHAYEWAGANLESRALVLAGPTAGNRLPAFADVRVLYGHPFETPDAEAQLGLVEGLYSSGAAPEAGLARLHDLGIHYVFYGPEEQSLGSPAWLDGLEVIYDREGVLIYGAGSP